MKKDGHRTAIQNKRQYRKQSTKMDGELVMNESGNRGKYRRTKKLEDRLADK